MLIMTSIICIGQSKFVTLPIDEDSEERIMNCLQTLAESAIKAPAEEIFLKDTQKAYSKMLHAQEVWYLVTITDSFPLTLDAGEGGGEERKGDEEECSAG